MFSAPRFPLLLALFLAGCPNEPSPTPGAANGAGTAPKPASSALAASPSASASATPDEPSPLCEKIAQKTWGTGANRVTGLSTKRLADDRIAIGFAFGNTPHVLVIKPSGEGELIKVAPAPGTALAKPVPAAEGTRTILRVTPYKVEGSSAKAYVDYRDEFKDKRKHIACGPADGGDEWISFDGVPLLDRDPKPTGEDRLALFKKSTEEGADEGYHELRDCRTFIDIKKNETYIIGSELRALDAGEDKTTYKSSLVVDTGPKKHEIHLREVDLKGDPPKDVPFDMPTTHGVKDGSYLLAVRSGGSLLAAFLKPDKSLQSKFVSYAGLPSRPEASRDDEGMTMMVASVNLGQSSELRGVRIGPKDELPKSMVKIETGDEDASSAVDPMFVRDAKNRRWLAYVAGPRGKGRLKLVGIDENFKPIGKPHPITKEAEGASEPRLVPLDDGRVLVTYIRESAGAAGELVSEVLRCDDPR